MGIFNEKNSFSIFCYLFYKVAISKVWNTFFILYEILVSLYSIYVHLISFYKPLNIELLSLWNL